MASSRRSGRPEAPGAAAGRAASDGGRVGVAQAVPAAGAVACAAVDAAVAQSLAHLPGRAVLVVAYSGGRDSTVLLDALARRLPAQQVVAWHVHHGLQPAADAWLAFCERAAARLGVRFGHARLGARPVGGLNVEAWAREERYAALWRAVADCGAHALLTAHHADDQLETVLMRLARGSGPEALGGMQPAERRDGGWLLRPLLGSGRDCIGECARARGLEWVEDPSNADPAQLRATLRARVLPALGAAVPGLRENVLRCAALLRATGAAARATAQADLRAAGLAVGLRSLDRCSLAEVPPLRRNEAVREWFRLLGLPMPTQARLEQWVAQLLLGGSVSARVDAPPWRFRRYRDRVTAEPADARDWERDPPPPLALHWAGEPALELPGWGGRLQLRPSADPAALDAGWLAVQGLEIRSPPAGARLRPRRGGPSRTLKNLYQERGIAPWLRAGLPAVFAGGRLVYAAGVGADASAPPAPAGRGVRLHWLPDAPDDPRAAGVEAASV